MTKPSNSRVQPKQKPKNQHYTNAYHNGDTMSTINIYSNVVEIKHGDILLRIVKSPIDIYVVQHILHEDTIAYSQYITTVK